MKALKCTECEFLLKKENISLLSHMMGYTAECKKNGVLFTLENVNKIPLWCPLKTNHKFIEKL